MLDLLADDPADTLIEERVERLLVDGLPTLPTLEERKQIGWAGKAPDVGGEDPIVAPSQS